jgi:hypothetical protein
MGQLEIRDGHLACLSTSHERDISAFRQSEPCFPASISSFTEGTWKNGVSADRSIVEKRNEQGLLWMSM